MKTIELEELRVGAQDTVLAEVLPAAHDREGHLPGARHLPLDALEDRAAEVIGARDRDVVVYCAGPTCNNSHQAAERLAAIGYERVSVFVGGKDAWRAAGLELERES